MVGASDSFFHANNPNCLVLSELNLFVKRVILLCANFSKNVTKTDRVVVGLKLVVGYISLHPKTGMARPISKQLGELPSIMFILNISETTDART